MGQFLVASVAFSDVVDAHVRRSSDAGFGCVFRRVIGDIHVVVHAPLNGTTVFQVDLEDGDFAIHTGTFFFDGAVGPSALRAFHGAFDPKNPPWARCNGHFALILRKHEHLYLLSDRLGSHHIYRRRGEDLYSSSFMAVLDSVHAPSLDRDGSYEYAWNGSSFGERTPFKEVRLVPAPALIRLADRSQVVRFGSAFASDCSAPKGGLEDIAEVQMQRLRSLFRTYSALVPRPFRSALSGGYDSRLILAGLQDAGIQPELFVFGRATDADVVCAKAVAAGEGLELRHLDKSTVAPPSPAQYAEVVQRDLYAFDGLKDGGLFDSGADFLDRMERERGDGVVLNGSAGEVYRNFFYLPDIRLTLGQLVSSFFSRFDPRVMTRAFSEARYRQLLTDDMRDVLGSSATTVDRAAVEALYPLFRGRFWSSRDVVVNQRFGWMLYPFLEPQVIEGTSAIPIRMKNHGRLEAAIIRAFSPRLAAYPTSYGFDLGGDPPVGYRVSMLSSMYRPTWVRRLTYRVARHGEAPAWLAPEYVGTVLDVQLPYMRKLFHIDRLADPVVRNRVATLEFLCQRANARES